MRLSLASVAIGFWMLVLFLAAQTASTPAFAQEKLLHNFQAKPALNPAAGLISDAAGNLYGTSGIGGNNCPKVCGTVFELTPTSTGLWNFHVIHNFRGGTDGQNPQGGLIFDADGNLYGTTEYGGSTDCFGQSYGCGTVFKLTHTATGWVESILYRFNDSAGGVFPFGTLVMDNAGNLYGSASGGGSTACDSFGCGTIFELSPRSGGWTETVLHGFSGASDGWQPDATLVFDSKGNLYGATGRGGSNACANGCGVLFELTPAGGSWTYSVPYAFTGASDGAFPSGVVLDADGNLYGTAHEGGSTTCQFGCGTAFELTPLSGGWGFSVLHSFDGSDGEFPNNIVFGNGNLYGTTVDGGGLGADCSDGCGTAFELVPTSGGVWTETVLHRFTGGKDGGQPLAGVLVDSAGDVFGTASDGGLYQFGVVFEITPSAN
jgi:uncharacterized repeat protein (TIGR03803 family)